MDIREHGGIFGGGGKAIQEYFGTSTFNFDSNDYIVPYGDLGVTPTVTAPYGGTGAGNVLVDNSSDFSVTLSNSIELGTPILVFDFGRDVGLGNTALNYVRISSDSYVQLGIEYSLDGVEWSRTANSTVTVNTSPQNLTLNQTSPGYTIIARYARIIVTKQAFGVSTVFSLRRVIFTPASTTALAYPVTHRSLWDRIDEQNSWHPTQVDRLIVKEYNNFTLRSGVTLTTAEICAGMLIYVKGNCTIAGTLNMSQKGGLFARKLPFTVPKTVELAYNKLLNDTSLYGGGGGAGGMGGGPTRGYYGGSGGPARPLLGGTGGGGGGGVANTGVQVQGLGGTSGKPVPDVYPFTSALDANRARIYYNSSGSQFNIEATESTLSGAGGSGCVTLNTTLSTSSHYAGSGGSSLGAGGGGGGGTIAGGSSGGSGLQGAGCGGFVGMFVQGNVSFTGGINVSGGVGGTGGGGRSSGGAITGGGGGGGGAGGGVAVIYYKGTLTSTGNLNANGGNGGSGGAGGSSGSYNGSPGEAGAPGTIQFRKL